MLCSRGVEYSTPKVNRSRRGGEGVSSCRSSGRGGEHGLAHGGARGQKNRKQEQRNDNCDGMQDGSHLPSPIERVTTKGKLNRHCCITRRFLQASVDCFTGISTEKIQ